MNERGECLRCRLALEEAAGELADDAEENDFLNQVRALLDGTDADIVPKVDQ